jgi:carbonic anhydrase
MRKAAMHVAVFFIMLSLIAPMLAAEDRAGCETGYDYGATKGPGQWGGLKTEWQRCDVGRYQSPIAFFSEPQDQTLSRNTLAYPATAYDIANNGLTVKLEPKNNAGTITRDGVTATLKEVHFHVPAEHTINQVPAAAEMHLVHALPDGRLVVTAVLINSSSAANATLQQIINHIPSACGGTGRIDNLSLAALMPQKDHYFTYFGSLTTPPCTEGVTWIVYAQEITASSAQINALKIAAKTGNARPIPGFVRWRTWQGIP